MPERDDNGWGEWRRHVLLQMEEHSKTLKEIKDEVKSMETEIALLKYKSSMWGAAGAALVVATYALFNFLKGH